MRPTRHALVQAVRSIVKPLAQPGGAALTNAQIILAHGKGPRPDLPYLTVHLLSAHVMLGTDAAPARAAARITVQTAATGYVYEIELGEITISHTRLLTDTNATVAAALVAAAEAASDHVYAAVLSGTPTAFWLFDALGRVPHHPGPELQVSADRETVYFPSGLRRLSVELQGFGSSSADWLASVQMGLSTPAALEAMQDAGLFLDAGTEGISSVPTLLDTSLEERFTLDLTGHYAVYDRPTLTSALGTVEIEGTIQIEEAAEEAPADPLDFTFDLEL